MLLKRLARDETAATAIEYGLIVALLAIAMAAALGSAGNSLSGVMTTATEGMGG